MNGYDNLYCMEVEPTVDMDELAMTDGMNQDAADGIKRLGGDGSLHLKWRFLASATFYVLASRSLGGQRRGQFGA